MRRHAGAGLATALLLGLAACAAGEPGGAATTSPAAADAATTEPGDEPRAPEVPAPPASCAALALEVGARISSTDLAACLTDHLRQAGSGSSESEQPGMRTTQRWALADGGLYAVGTRDGEPSVVLTPDAGWVHTDEGWVRGDPGGSPQEQLAAEGVELYRATSMPEMTYAMVAQAPGFTVGAQEELTTADGSTTLLWPIRSDGPFAPFPGAPPELTTTELVVWTATPGPTYRLDVTSGAVTARTTYGGWGEAVDLAEVEELLGAALPRP